MAVTRIKASPLFTSVKLEKFRVMRDRPVNASKTENHSGLLTFNLKGWHVTQERLQLIYRIDISQNKTSRAEDTPIKSVMGTNDKKLY